MFERGDSNVESNKSTQQSDPFKTSALLIIV